ncbi:glycosyl/glycerophosphate transferase teichoic acid biosynthesis [Brevibacterium sediminis]|uniref:Glycosyl/glycerophosphate transferase teichoic acid biosynthesis n=1 Tax=Brevibacterium sediminis TaxID=1857024 RepID=A0ABQ1MX04_9MICO|nr:CDP-glycerol glycerophosphotransferase family protein [Brevibacterium sediminis]GGC48667.1 glycosyl/glycerophosphate transferase teichoic acid biosynthesis [Brevibacterium sediminis]
MSGQQWRKALWHLRHGGVEGFKEFRRKRESELNSTRTSTVGPPIEDGTDTPTLTVIVPAFNASDFIDRCLKSILSQSGVSLEVIVVDDGSTDETVEKAKQHSHGAQPVTVLTGPNEGPARARNRGVDEARGKYITFADADDEVLANAYATLVDSLERTGSDIATGAYVRVGSAGRSRPKLTARVHARQRLAVRLDDMPELLEEPVLWNKVYRHDFWNRHVGEMWGFSNYEDQEPVYRALVGAAAIDVLTNDVYAWRLADGRDTRSKRKAELSDLQSKLEVIEVLRETLHHSSGHVVEQAYAIWMGTDLAMHAEYLDTANKRFRKTLCDAARVLRKSMPKGAWKLMPAQERLYMWIVASGDLDDIEEVLGTRMEETRAVPLELADGTWMVAPTYLSRLKTDVPQRLLKAQSVDFKPVVIVRNARWISEQQIELQGCAYIPGVDPGRTTFRMQGVMDGATVLDCAVETRNDNRVDLDVGDPWRTYEAGGFTVAIDVSGLGDVSPRGIDLIGSFEIEGNHLQVPAVSTAVVGMIAPSPIRDSGRMTVVADDRSELSIRPVAMPTDPVVVKNVDFRGRDVTVTVDDSANVRSLTMRAAKHDIQLKPQGPSIFTATLPELPEQFRSKGERQWKLTAMTRDDHDVDVYHSAVDYLLPGTSCVRLAANSAGKVRLAQRFRRVTVTGATNDRDRLLIIGRIDPPEKLKVVLKSSEQTIEPAESAFHADGSFTAVYDLTTTGAEGGTVAALSGGYHVRFDSSPDTSKSWARVAGKLAIRPVDVFTEWNTLRLEGRASGSVAITASPPWSPKERTKFGRFALRERDWGPIREGILFESFNGKSCNDNPRAIFDAVLERDLRTPLYWSVRDRTVEVPPGSIPVVEGTGVWHRALATSQSWVNNNNFPYYVRKRPGQFYLQTWHGTPIKRLLWDIPRRKVSLSYRRIMKTEVPQWDLLLAQSASAVKNLRSGLGYQGRIALGQYPRNIRLFADCSEDRSRSLRKELGIPAGRKVVLYAPTWREMHRNGSRTAWGGCLEPGRLAIRTNTTVLVRAHHMTDSETCSADHVVDVSRWPHVEDIFLLADVLVTDFSSIAFDFAVTGKPVIHHMTEARAYARERGMYDHWANEYSQLTYSDAELVDAIASAGAKQVARGCPPDLSPLIDCLTGDQREMASAAGTDEGKI